MLRSFRFVLVALVLGVFCGCGGAKKREADYAATTPLAVVRSEKAETPETANCPLGMLLIPSGPTRYGPTEEKGAPRLLTDGERLTMKAFCIDRYEYPNLQGEQPMRGITWMEAADLCKTKGKRLCTENEFEKACRGPVTTLYAYGDGFAAGVCPTAAQEYVSGQFLNCVSGFGVMDMSGGVYEWTANAPTPSGDERYVRGGMGAEKPQVSSRCTFRARYNTSVSNREIGFRCCASVLKEDAPPKK